MIPTDITYIRVDSPEEAVLAWSSHPGARYLAGGTEITTTARRSAAFTLTALIDVKALAETQILETQAGCTALGTALPLSTLEDWPGFPLLSSTIKGIADRTVRNRLTLGGNIAGMLPYREAILPLLLADATGISIVPGPGGAAPARKVWRLRERFDKRLILDPGELVLNFSLPADFTSLPWSHQRKTRTGIVDYPLVTLCMVRDGAAFRLGVSGAHPYPQRSDAADAALAAGTMPTRRNIPSKVDEVMDALGLLLSDQRASGDYREALLRLLIGSALEELS